MLVTLTRLVDPWEAQVLRSRLEADGIPATVAHAGHAVVHWPMSLALGGTAVQVPEAFLAASRALLAAYRAGDLEEVLNAELGMHAEHCPRCGSRQFLRTMSPRDRAIALLIVLLFAPFPARRSLRICDACGFRWRWGDAASTTPAHGTGVSRDPAAQ